MTQCVHVKSNGKRCRTTRTFTTPVGRLCRWHRPTDHVEPPIKRIRNVEDATRLAEWAVLQAARGKVHGNILTGISSVLKEWRQLHVENISKQEQRAADILIMALIEFYREHPDRSIRSVPEKAYQQWLRFYRKRTGAVMQSELRKLAPEDDDEGLD